MAGLISTDHPKSLEWRREVTPTLEEAGFEVRDPLAGKGNIKCLTSDGGMTVTNTPNRAILLRDRQDVREADIILANLDLFDSGRPMLGTIAELGWAWDAQKPVVAYVPLLGDHPKPIDKGGKIVFVFASLEEHEKRKKHISLMLGHPFMSEFVTKYVRELPAAVDFIIDYYGQNKAV